MIHHSIVASRGVARIIGALCTPLLAVIGASLPNAASAGGAVALDSQPPLRGAYCGGSSEDPTPARAGCARISGYITAGARFGSNERIGGRRDPFGPIGEPAIAGNQASGLTIVGAPLSGDRFLTPTSAADIAH